MIDKRFGIGDRKYHIFDVGGQKSERKKWYRYVDDVKAVVFVVSLACYNEVMYEDQTKNCMVDALALFSETVNNDHFRNAPFILFLSVYIDSIHGLSISSSTLSVHTCFQTGYPIIAMYFHSHSHRNKKDLFQDKIKRLPITACPAFEDFDTKEKDPQDFEDCVEYIEEKFKSQRENTYNDVGRERQLYVHVTCAMDDDNIKKVFDDVTRLIVEQIMTNMKVCLLSVTFCPHFGWRILKTICDVIHVHKPLQHMV